MNIPCDVKIEKKFLILWGVVLFVILIIADQLTKYFIVINSHSLYSCPITIIPCCLNIVTVRNTGAAWGMFHDNNAVLLTVAVFALVIFAVFFRAITEWYPERVIGFFMIVSGIAGNSLDRILRGSVVDFLDVYFNNWHWPAFNVADSAICVGVAIIILSTIFRAARQRGTQG